MLFEQIKILIRNTIKENAFPCFAKIYEVQSKEYTCHCRELTNDLEETETIYTRVQIPKLVASKEGGIFLTPNKDTLVLLNFLNGDRNYPIISAILGEENFPNSPVDKLVIKAGGKDLGEILIAMCKKISGITTAGSPTTQTLRPDQIVDWEKFVEQEIKQLFGESSPEGGDSSNPEPEPEPEKPKPDPEPEKPDPEPEPEPEPETDLFAMETKDETGKLVLVPATVLLDQLHKIEPKNEPKSGARAHLEYMAKKVRSELGKEFKTIVITSVHRTVEEQVIILSKKMRKVNTKLNMFEYYESQIDEKTLYSSKTLKYLDAIQAYYDNTEPNTDRWKQIIGSHQEEIANMGDEPLGGDRTKMAEALLNKYMKAGYFTPSYHMTSIGECYLLDIRIKDNREQTADRLFAENKTYYTDCKNTLPDEKCTAGYKIGLDDKSGDPHIHLCLRKDYKP